jgi:hypothetical protein
MIASVQVLSLHPSSDEAWSGSLTPSGWSTSEATIARYSNFFTEDEGQA